MSANDPSPTPAHRAAEVRAKPLAIGLRDLVHDSQRTFRTALDALARPGRIASLAHLPAPGVALSPAVALLLLTLTDETTLVHWQTGLPNGDALASWLRFHTGAQHTRDPQQADFAVINASEGVLALDAFKAGSSLAPATSATLLIQVPSLSEGQSHLWRGPGIAAPFEVRVGEVTADFWRQWHQNTQRFPEGVDVIWCCGAQIIGMPRTTKVDCTDTIDPKGQPCMSR